MFVEREIDPTSPRAGRVKGVYGVPQDYAAEELPDDHPDVADFNEYVESILSRPKPIAATLYEKLAAIGITVAELKAELARPSPA